MSLESPITTTGRVDEPQALQDYADVLSRVASERRPLIVRRNGADLAAVIPLEHPDLLQEALDRKEAEQLAAQIDWDRARQALQPAQEWFEGDEPKPF